MKMSRFLVGFVFAFCLVCFSQDKEKNTNEFYDLSEEDVVKFIKILPEFRNVFISGGDETKDANLMLMALKKLPAQRLSELAKKGGFKDDKEFMNVAGGTFVAYALLKSKELEVQLDASMKELPAEMQAMLKPQLEAAKQQLKLFENKISKGTINVVKKHYDVIDSLFTGEEE